MRDHRSLGCILAVILSASALFAADEKPSAKPTQPAPPASQPASIVATRPKPTERLLAIKAMIAKLSVDDFQTRDAARVALMGLKRSEIAAIREAIKQSLPLEPSQMVVLREVVTHVYLAGDDYEPTNDNSGFLGVSLPNNYSDEDRDLTTMAHGVAIISRVPGFCAYRMLQNGDVILAMKGTGPDAPDVHFTSTEQFIETVRAVHAGDKVTFDVMRQGRVVTVTITLDRRPEVLNPKPNQFGNFDALQIFKNRRAEQADELWEKDFGPLLGEQVG